MFINSRIPDLTDCSLPVFFFFPVKINFTKLRQLLVDPSLWFDLAVIHWKIHCLFIMHNQSVSILMTDRDRHLPCWPLILKQKFGLNQPSICPHTRFLCCYLISLENATVAHLSHASWLADCNAITSPRWSCSLSPLSLYTGREDASVLLCVCCPWTSFAIAALQLSLLQKHWSTQTFQFIISPFRSCCFFLCFFFLLPQRQSMTANQG